MTIAQEDNSGVSHQLKVLSKKKSVGGDSIESGRFSPEIIGNKFDIRSDLLGTGQFTDRNESRISNDDQKYTDTLEANDQINEDKNKDENKLKYEKEHKNGDNLISESMNGPEIVQNEPLKTDAREQDDIHDMPTWLRKLTNLQNYNFSNDSNSNRWKDLKQVLRFGKSRKDSQTQIPSNRRPSAYVDESEEQAKMRASNLITSLISGSPAALFIGSSFLSDEHQARRAPLLLSLLGLEVKDILTPKNHHEKFQIDLEYGIGDNRLKWSIVRDLRGLISLHSKLKVILFQSKNLKGNKTATLPKFPKLKDDQDSSNYLTATLNEQYLSMRDTPKDLNNSNRIQDYNFSNSTNNSTNLENTPLSHSRNSLTSEAHSSSGNIRSKLHRIASRVSSAHINDDHSQIDEIDEVNQREIFRRKIENYLKQLVTALSLQPQANRLFQFFELSPLGVLLSYETGYQGKQGYLIVGSSAKAQGWRVGHLKLSDFKQMVQRHTNKWFLVRDSYIMYVSGIYSTTPLEVFFVDDQFKVTFSGNENRRSENQDNESLYDDDMSIDDSLENLNLKSSRLSTHFVIRLENRERSLKIFARSEYQVKLWVKSIETMQKNTIWSIKHRFESFAPVRKNCYAQWFVDGRDHFWAISSALELAKDVIYLHDWWLSPELYLRRPANGNQEWRLDRVLKRKAEQGVKIFVIVYRNVGTTVVTDSLWTKHSLIDLHPNIHVLRSPNQWLQNTYFWAHHEKLCIVDHTVAFVGGIDLCFGRYDTPDHVLSDDSPHDFSTRQNTTEESIKYQKFPGKDYSNPRVKDFFDLDKPYESMYDRETTPRMPWHDVHMMTAGQPASDLSRHFIQRWNYLLRQKRPSRPTPILTPPPDWSEENLARFDLTGSCEVQLVRSSCNWSLGLKEKESSIQNAYLKLIETSEHFVYIENQFFITSTTFENIVIENRIGDALVDRIIRAHNERKRWRAVIVIPLMPGFESQVDEAEGSSVRVIMKSQYMSISRGPTSIFGKLQKMKINPYDYIQFFSLRKWGRIGPHRKIVTEQLYIHSKILIVDDRIALIGSANINERSQRGSRDSEVCAVVRDSDTVETTMNGVPYKAGKFAHTLRVRLMREHIGIDVDILEIVEKRFSKIEEIARQEKDGTKTRNFSNKDFEVKSSMVELASRDVLNLPNGTDKWKKFQKQTESLNNSEIINTKNQKNTNKKTSTSYKTPPNLQEKSPLSFQPLYFHSFNNRAREENIGIRENKQLSSDSRITHNLEHKNDVDGNGIDRMDSKESRDYKINAAKTLRKWAKESLANNKNKIFLPNIEQVLGFLDDEHILGDLTNLTNEQELWVNERNQERWNMLKRITYLQRVAAKQQNQNEEENTRRTKVGLSPLFQTSTKTDSQKGQSDGHVRVGSNSSNDQSSSENSILNEPSNPLEMIEDIPGQNIPVVSLDNAGIHEILAKATLPGTSLNVNKFIDPYGFGDPLDDSFYEDVWFDNALKNTLIFREVFHCQPDDTVTTWKHYKAFTRLGAAFNLAQDQEITRREASMQRDSLSAEEESDFTSSRSFEDSKSINVDDINGKDSSDGIIGKAPSSTLDSSNKAETDLNTETTNTSPNSGSNNIRSKSSLYGYRKRIGLGDNETRVFDRPTAEKLLDEIQGHLVLFPVDWLYKEIEGGNWYYNMDRIPPIEIYD
ncbi:hypothetical protein WICMUC_001654 [Wickerhamomyces mucosus]|uniref:Phospholipase n=1 Tax=Wickerhamomyces mucosus TaxID=1378264 RepID=A0A9P8PV93_9ASCO|nr:hypothetical protein WICMUC_001654 [Wickerhamomyces mucosus]